MIDQSKRPRVGDWQRQLDTISKLKTGFLKTEAVTHSADIITSKSLPKGGKPMVVIGKPVLVRNHHVTNVTDFVITPCHCETSLIHACKDLWNLVPSDTEREYIEKNRRGSFESCSKEDFWIFAL